MPQKGKGGCSSACRSAQSSVPALAESAPSTNQRRTFAGAASLRAGLPAHRHPLPRPSPSCHPSFPGRGSAAQQRRQRLLQPYARTCGACTRLLRGSSAQAAALHAALQELQRGADGQRPREEATNEDEKEAGKSTSPPLAAAAAARRTPFLGASSSSSNFVAALPVTARSGTSNSSSSGAACASLSRHSWHVGQAQRHRDTHAHTRAGSARRHSTHPRLDHPPFWLIMCVLCLF